jgi:tetratricopeptide (TPR) repeat protein
VNTSPEPRNGLLKGVAWVVGIAAVVGGIWFLIHENDHEARGNEAMNALDYDRALSHYSALVKDKPDEPIGRYLRGACYRSIREFDLAESDARSLIADGHVAGYSQMGRIRLAQRRYPEAADFFRQARAKSSSTLFTDHLDMADYHIQRREFADAARELDAADRMEPNDPFTMSQRASLASAKYDTDAAVGWYDKVIAREPKEFTHYVGRAYEYRWSLRDGLALADLDTAHKLCPRSAGVWHGRSDIALDRGEYDTALAHIQKAIDQAPWEPTYYRARGMVQYYRKEYQKAVDDHASSLNRDSNDPYGYAYQVYPLLKLGRHREAKAAGEKAVNLDDTCATAHDALAWVLAMCPDAAYRDGKKAHEHATRACELTFYKDPYCLISLAAAHAEVGDFAAAKEWQKKCLALRAPVVPDDQEENQKRLKLYDEGKPYRVK